MTARREPAAASRRTPATSAGVASVKKAAAVEGAKPSGEPLVWPSRHDRHVSKATSQLILVRPNPESDSAAGIAGRITHRLREQTVPKTVQSQPVDLAEFIKAQARKRTIKEVARLTGLSTRTVEKLRMHGGASGDAITKWCKADEAFRGAYFHYCGGPDADLLRGLTLAVQSVIRDHQ